MTLNWTPEIYMKAWEFATIAHAGQTYGSKKEGYKIEYIHHIGAVAMEMIYALQQSPNRFNESLAIQCALLHDTIEDTQVTYENIVKDFGIEVGNGVLALTKDDKIDATEMKMADSLNRIKQQPPEIAMVKMADRICNLDHPPYYWNKQKISNYCNEATMILANLREANLFLSERLSNKIALYQKFFI